MVLVVTGMVLVVSASYLSDPSHDGRMVRVVHRLAVSDGRGSPPSAAASSSFAKSHTTWRGRACSVWSGYAGMATCASSSTPVVVLMVVVVLMMVGDDYGAPYLPQPQLQLGHGRLECLHVTVGTASRRRRYLGIL